MKMTLPTLLVTGSLAFAAFGASLPAQAATVMQQCGQQYQAAKAAGTLNGMTWNQFRSDCSAKLKAQPAAATATAPAAPATQTANPLNPAPAPAAAAAPAAPAAAAPATTAAAPAAPAAPGSTAAPAASTGRTAFYAREKQCGAEWRANKDSLTKQTPGLTWPKYLSQCNARLKSAGK